MYATAVVGAALLAIGAYRLFRGRSGTQGVRSEAGEDARPLSPEEQLQLAEELYGQRFRYGAVGRGGRVGPHRIVSVDILQCGPTSLHDPLAGRGRVSSGFTRRDGSYHGAIDIAAPTKAPVYAAHEGLISYAGPGTGYGRYIDIQHLRFDLVTRYGHLEAFAPGIRSGTPVASGQLIGYVGNVGRSTGSHLHFEVMQGREWLDPKLFLPGR
mgnify:CR=1 FL=1